MSLPKPVVVAVAVVLAQSFKKKNLRRTWTKRWLRERRKHTILNLLQEIRTSEPNDFRNYLRMDETLFKRLLGIVTPRIERQNTVMRESVSAEERLIVTLRYLATGNTYEDLKFSTAISPQSLGRIIPEICKAI